MNVVIPFLADESNLTTNVVNSNADWEAGEYTEGQRVVHNEYVWEALGTTTDEPTDQSDEWLRLGRPNTLRMWRDGQDSRSSRNDNITTGVYVTEVASSVGLLGLRGITATVTVTDDIEGEVYNQTKDIIDIGVGDWWEYYLLPYSEVSALYFDDLPNYAPATIGIVIQAASETDPAECGRAIIGQAQDIGVSVNDISVRIEDFSRKSRDEFGDLVLVPRRAIKIVDYDIIMESANADFVERRFNSLAGQAALYVGETDIPESIVFGVFETFSLISRGLSYSEAATSVQEF